LALSALDGNKERVLISDKAGEHKIEDEDEDENENEDEEDLDKPNRPRPPSRTRSWNSLDFEKNYEIGLGCIGKST